MAQVNGSVGGSPRIRRVGVRQILLRLFPRSAYRVVWNWEARTRTHARVFVSGTAEEAEWLRSGQSTADDVAREARVTPADTVLEIGCGAARVGRHLAPRCRQWIGADVSPRMLRHAARELVGLQNVRLEPLSGHDLVGFADDSIDVVYCTGVFMHLDEWDRYDYVAEAFRVLRPGGRLYIDNFTLTGDEGWALFLDMRRYAPRCRPLNISKASTPEELRVYAERAGFGAIRVRAGSLWVSVFAEKGR